jgi:hypothetical protein
MSMMPPLAPLIASRLRSRSTPLHGMGTSTPGLGRLVGQGARSFLFLPKKAHPGHTLFIP